MNRASETGIPLDLWARFPAMTCVADASGRIQEANEAWTEALGYDAGELAGRTIVDLVAPEDREAVAALFADPPGDALSFEARLLTKRGHLRLIGVDAVIARDKDRIYAVARDLSAKVEVEKQRERLEEMFRLVVDNVPQQICWKDMQSVFLGCNKPFAEAAGLTNPLEIVGRRDPEIPWTDAAPSSRAYGRELMIPDPVGSRSVEPLMAPNGTKAWLDLIKLPLHDGEGNVYGNLTIYEDITHARRHEEEIARFFNVSTEPLAVLSSSGKFVRMNRCWTSTLGYTVEELMEMRLQDLVHTKDIVPATEQLKRVMDGETILGLECRCRSRTGIYVWLSWSLLSVPEEGLIYAAVCNVDRRKRLERALMQRIEMKTQVSTVSNTFLNVRFEEIDGAINKALGQLGELLDADRTSLYLLSDDGETIRSNHEWCGDGVPSLLEARRLVSRSERRWLLERLYTLEPVHVPRVADLPRDARNERMAFERQGVKSLLRVPLTYAGRLIGAVGLDSVKNHKSWDKDALSLLRLISEGFAVTVERKRAEEALREKLEVIERQESAIQTLSTPIIRVWDGVLALPLVGAIDSRRAAEITHKLLHAIVETKSRHAIVELTGVEEIDVGTAHHLLGMLRTIEFLGARGIVAGVRPAVAKTMAALDFELTRMSIQRDLQHALKLCMIEGPRRRRAVRVAPPQPEREREAPPDSSA